MAYKYKIIVDVGIPYTIEVDTDEQLIKELKELSKKADTEPCFNLIILNDKGEDISESQFIEEIVEEILNEA